jgi:uncharacterized protein (DUF111 family)
MTMKYVNGVLVEMTQEEVDSLTPTAEQVEAEELRKADQTAYQQNFDALKANQQARQLLKATPAQIDSYIETNVTNLASAKEVLKLLAKAVSVLAHEVYR